MARPARSLSLTTRRSTHARAPAGRARTVRVAAQVRIQFELEGASPDVRVIGNHPALGNWDPAHGLRNGDFITLEDPGAMSLEYKWHNGSEYEMGGNRMVVLPDAADRVPRVAGLPVDDPDVASVLFDATAIEGALETLAALVVMRMNEFSVFVPVTTGAMMFASDLLRQTYVTQRTLRAELDRPYDRPVIACATCASYGDGTVSGEAKTAHAPSEATVRGKRCVIIEDIIDTGKTVVALAKELYARGAEEVAVIALMDKQARRDEACAKWMREKDMKIAAAFMCPDEFVVGYGLDYRGKYRELPFVGILKPEIFQS